MEVRKAAFLMVIVLALWVLPAGTVDTGIEPSMKSIPPSHLEDQVPTPSAAPEDPCGNRTVTCTVGSSIKDYIVPWLSCVLSFGVSLVPILRVMGLQPASRGAETTLFWWFLCFTSGDYLVWSFYFQSCYSPTYTIFPVLLMSILEVIIYFILFVISAVKTSAVGDLRVHVGCLLVAFCFFAGLIWSNSQNLGWFALALAVTSQLFRMGSMDYHGNFNMILFAASIVGGISALLWLTHQICVCQGNIS